MPPRARSASSSGGAREVPVPTAEQISSASTLLVVGKEDLLTERAIATVWTQLRKQDPGHERRVVDAAASEAAGSFAMHSAPSLFGDAAMLVVTHAEAADDALQQAIVANYEQPADAITVVVCHDGGARGSGPINKLRKAGVPEFRADPLKGRAIDGFIEREMRANGRRVTAEAVAVLRTAIGADLRGLAAACSQLCADVDHDPIDVEQVREYHGGVAEIAGWDLSDALLDTRLAEVVRLLRWAFELDAGSGPKYTASIASGLRTLVTYAGARSLPEAQLAREVGIAPWKIPTLRAQLQRWRPEDLAIAVRLIAAADGVVKGRDAAGDGVDPSVAAYTLERTVVAISTRDA